MRKQRHSLSNGHVIALGTVAVLMAALLMAVFLAATW
jgi:hypothetical protein